MPTPGHATARGRLEGSAASPAQPAGQAHPPRQSEGLGALLGGAGAFSHADPALTHSQLGGVPAVSPSRQPGRARQLVRFRPSLRPREIRQPEMMPNLQYRSTAEAGFRVPKLSFPRERDAEEARDPLYSARRRRILEVRGVESIEASTNRRGALSGTQPAHSRVTIIQVVPDREEGAGLGGQRESIWKDTSDRNAKISIDSGTGPDETSLKRITDKGITQHLKLDEWYEGLVGADADYRSNALFLEVKMRELLGDDWADSTHSSHPPLLRATVCVDLLGRLVRSLPGLAGMGEVLWREVVRSVFDGGVSGTGGGWGEAYFDKVKALESRVATLAEEVKTLRAHTQTPEDRRQQKSNMLLSRISGRVFHESFKQWRIMSARNNAWKGFKRQMNKRYQVLWVWRTFYTWVAATETAKRQRWQSIAEMLKWDQEYGVHARMFAGGGLRGDDDSGYSTPSSASHFAQAASSASIARGAGGKPLSMQELRAVSSQQQKDSRAAAERKQAEDAELRQKLMAQRALQDGAHQDDAASSLKRIAGLESSVSHSSPSLPPSVRGESSREF